MTRTLYHVMIYVVFGGLMTILVSWALAIWSDLSSAERTYGLSSGHGPRWKFEKLKTTGVIRLSSSIFDESASHLVIRSTGMPYVPRPDQVPSWSHMAEPSTVTDATIIEDGRGWPAIALYSELFRLEEGCITEHGIKLMPNRDSTELIRLPRALPTAINPMGAVIDVLFYSSIGFLFVIGRRALISWYRTTNGLCPICKYDLRGEMKAGCPECGWNRQMEHSC